MNFTAIDFETANEKRNSPCSIGIAVVRDGQVVEKVHHLIRPREMRFMPINIGIHGIRPGMVEKEPEFDQVWEKIRHHFDGSLVIAHNASFDVSVLRNTLELYGIEAPCFDYMCTMKLARNFYTSLENAKLDTVNKHLGFKFNHHDALADALACSNILLSIAKELNTDDIREISKLAGVTIGNVNKDGYSPSSTKGRVLSTSSREACQRKAERFNAHAFKDEVVVFTGGLGCMTRDEAIRLVRNLGGIAGSSVTRKTTILVTNMKGVQDLCREEMSTKMRKAMDLRERGQEIKLLNEEEFMNKARVS